MIIYYITDKYSRQNPELYSMHDNLYDAVATVSAMELYIPGLKYKICSYNIISNEYCNTNNMELNLDSRLSLEELPEKLRNNIEINDKNTKLVKPIIENKSKTPMMDLMEYGMQPIYKNNN